MRAFILNWGTGSEAAAVRRAAVTDFDTNPLKLAQKQPASNAKHGMADRQDNEVS